MEPNPKENLVHRYLLGDLPEEEQLALERDYFTNPDVFDRVWEIENDLVDRYVRGRLNHNEKQLFEQNYLASPIHRERVTFAVALVEAVDSGAEKSPAVEGAAAPVSWWSRLWVSLRGNSWQWATVAAVVLLGAVSIMLLADRARLHRQIDQLKAETSSEQQRTQELEKEIAVQRDQSDKLAAEITRLHEAPPNVDVPSQPSQNEVRPVLSLVLSPMLMRSESEAQQLRLTKETAAVLLQMRVQRSDARSYQVDLRTVDGVKVWSTAAVKARSSAKDRSTVSVSIPASKLDTNEYILTLSATNDANQTEEINRYFFRVSKE
jgi:hypothetical protein